MELATFPDVSIAIQVTVVIPIGNETGASLAIDSTPIMSVTVGSPSSR